MGNTQKNQNPNLKVNAAGEINEPKKSIVIATNHTTNKF